MTTVESMLVEVNADQTLGSVHFKELAYNDFGSSGLLQPQSISRMFESGRTFALTSGFVDGHSVVNEEYGMFVLGLHYTFHPALWSVRCGQTFPYKIETQMQDIGQTSITLQSRLINKLDHVILATLDFKYVYVHRKTGRSTPLPDLMLQKYDSILKERRPIVLSKEIPQVPASAYRYEVSVEESDTDRNQHTNQGSYVRYCWDTTHAAVKEGRLPQLQPSAWRFPILKLQAIHTGETWMGDKLHVFLWQQEDCQDTVVYVIKRLSSEEEKVVYHAAMVFGHPPDLSSHL